MNKGKNNCQTCAIWASSIFSALDVELRAKLDTEKAYRIYKAGQVLFYEGDPPLAVYCVSSGKVKIYKSDKEGPEQIIRLAGAGELIGYRALLSNEVFAATAQAIEDSGICVIEKGMFLELIRQSSSLSIAIMTRLAKELRISEELLLAQSQLTIRQRLARLLLRLAQEKIEEGIAPITVVTSLKKFEMAQIIGTSPVAFSRELHRLARNGILEVGRIKIKILNIEALQKAAQ